jgi:hypothetical protein
MMQCMIAGADIKATMGKARRNRMTLPLQHGEIIDGKMDPF